MVIDIFDFDDTLYRIPSHTVAPPDFDITGDVHKWYDHPDSLDFTRYRVQLIENVAKRVRESYVDKYTETILITRRVLAMRPAVNKVLERDKIRFDRKFLIGHGPKSAKSDIVHQLMVNEFIGKSEYDINIYEDSMTQILAYRDFFRTFSIGAPIRVRYFFVDKTDLIKLDMPNGEILERLKLKD